MRVDLVELSRRTLVNYDAKAQRSCDGELLNLTTRDAYVLQAEIGRARDAGTEAKWTPEGQARQGIDRPTK